MRSANFHDSMSFSAWSESDVTIADVRRALAARDPDFAWLVVQLATGRDPDPAVQAAAAARVATKKRVRVRVRVPAKAGGAKRGEDEPAMTLPRMMAHMRSWPYKQSSPEERASWRRQAMAQLESEDAAEPLPPRFELGPLLRELYESDGPFERRALLDIIAHIPLRWGPWRALKQMFKDAESSADFEVWGALAARFDSAYAGAAPNPGSDVSSRTLGYLSRRAWRRLRQLASTLPAVYADAASAVLRFYPDGVAWQQTWLGAQILYRETGDFSRTRFRGWRVPDSPTTHRAHAELWQRSPRPLFSLAERARSQHVQRYATAALRQDFRAVLRDVEPAWVVRLIAATRGRVSDPVDDFVIWLLEAVPRFEQGAFRELGLHEPVLDMMQMAPPYVSKKACAWAAAYARAHARDLPVDTLVELAAHPVDEVQSLAIDLLRDRDPRDEVGLDAWSELLAVSNTSDLAREVLRKHFSAAELTPEWFAERLASESWAVRSFAVKELPRLHDLKTLGGAWIAALLDTEHGTDSARELFEALGPANVDPALYRELLVHPDEWRRYAHWMREEWIAPESVGAEHLKRLAYEGTWDASDWVTDLRARREWARELTYDDDRAALAREYLADVRRFSPEELGFDWLMQLVRREEPAYFDFAVSYMTKAFVPADFAPDATDDEAADAPGDGEIAIDLGGQSFVFTGKLATMTRKEAQGKVTAAGGANAKSVNKKLDYLVIGDEGSPLYDGGGRKGSKQKKAEKLIEDGVELKIISETAFLQMLAGEQREFSEDAIEAGCLALWSMATEGDLERPESRFAREFIRLHHPEIALRETDRPVDPGAEMPPWFLTFERVSTLLERDERTLRTFALTLCREEFATWAPPIDAIVRLAELPHEDVREFVTSALLADDTREHRSYRIDPEVLTADAVYGFCESLEAATRALGMALIARDPRLAVPAELFRLTESPDRRVRAFVIRTFWQLYRERGVTDGWVPTAAKAPEVTRKRGRKRRADAEPETPPVTPTQRPDAPPAGEDALDGLLRRVLFGIPPARLPPRPAGADRLPPLPARKAKLGMVEVIRDLAVDDRALAVRVAPLLRAFMGSRGESERAACLVALVRLRAAHDELDIALN